MKNPIKWLNRKRFPYKPMITVELSKANLLHNLNSFRKLAPEGQVAPVLKSNAYGHGIIEIAQILDKEPGIPFLIIDSYFEAVALRAKGVHSPLLIIGYTTAENIKGSNMRDIMFSVGHLDVLKDLKDLKHNISIHLKIDTGMHRQGIQDEDIDEAIKLIKENSKLEIKGIFSHLNDSDSEDSKYTSDQIKLWNEIAAKMKGNFPGIKHIHLSATFGHRFGKSIEANISRLGLGLYGLLGGDIFDPKIDLKPVMSMKTVVASVKKIKAGDSVGYNNTFTAKNEMTIATIPVGYFEGVDRRLSNKGEMIIGEKSCRILGNVSMNMTTLDVSHLAEVKLNDSVSVISDMPNDPNSLVAWSKQFGIIPYELAIHIPEHLKRVVI